MEYLIRTLSKVLKKIILSSSLKGDFENFNFLNIRFTKKWHENGEPTD